MYTNPPPSDSPPAESPYSSSRKQLGSGIPAARSRSRTSSSNHITYEQYTQGLSTSMSSMSLGAGMYNDALIDSEFDPSLDDAEILEMGMSHEILSDELYMPSHPSRDWIRCYISSTGPGTYRMYLEGKKRVRFLMSAKQFSTGATFLISTSEDFPVLDIVPRAGYVARLEKQKDLSYLLCLNYCHLCDYLLGGCSGCCGRGTKEREVLAKVSHFFKQYRGMNAMGGNVQQLQYRCVNVYIPSISRTGKRKIWCPRSFRRAHNDRIGNEVDVNTAIALDREMESYTLFKNKTPEWSDQLGSLVVKFQGNRILTASARNFLLCASSLHNSPSHMGPKSTSSIYYYSDEEDEQYAPPPKSPYERRLAKSHNNATNANNSNAGANFITIQAIQRGASTALAANGARARRSSSSFDSSDGNAALLKSKSRSRANSSIGATPKTTKRKTTAAATPALATDQQGSGVAASSALQTRSVSAGVDSDGVWIGASSPVSSTNGTNTNTTTATSIGSFDSPAPSQSLLKRTLSLNMPDEEEPILQFGKSSPTRFILDFKYPLSPLQAFGIALASFATDEPSLQRNEGKEANYRVRGFSVEESY